MHLKVHYLFFMIQKKNVVNGRKGRKIYGIQRSDNGEKKYPFL